jgi:hypothetical protein
MFNPNSKRWEPDNTPDSGQPPAQLPAANLKPSSVPPATLTDPTVPPSTPSASLPDKKVLSSLVATVHLPIWTMILMLALRMKHL